MPNSTKSQTQCYTLGCSGCTCALGEATDLRGEGTTEETSTPTPTLISSGERVTPGRITPKGSAPQEAPSGGAVGLSTLTRGDPRLALLGVVLLWLSLWTGWRQGWAPVTPAQGAKVAAAGDWEPVCGDTGETGLSTSGQCLNP